MAKRSAMREKIRTWKGDILIGVLIPNDVVYIKTSKKALNELLDDVSESCFSTSVVNGALYFDANN